MKHVRSEEEQGHMMGRLTESTRPFSAWDHDRSRLTGCAGS